MTSRTRINRAWAVPAIALAGVVSVGALPRAFSSSASASPQLPTLTPAELLSKVRTAQVKSFSGTITLNSALGLPSIGAIAGLGAGNSTSVTGLISGKHSASVWADGTDHLRFATAAPLQETNWVRNGNDLWSYESSSSQATHYAMSKSSSGNDASSGTAQVPALSSVPDPAHETPAQFADELLAAVTPSTDVTVADPISIAGRSAYQLVLTPQLADSTVKDITIAIDSATGLPLDVSVVARATSTVALEFGFTDISFTRPSASTFDFTPPPGSTVVQAASMSEFLTGGPARHHRRADRSGATTAPTDTPTAATTPSSDPAPTDRTSTDPATTDHSPTVLGSDWGSVVVLPSGTAPPQLTALVTAIPSLTQSAPNGRVFTSTLFSVLLLDDGRVAIGAITPSALEARVTAG